MLTRTPLVLVPGLLCDALLWQPQIDALADIAAPQVADHTRHDTMAGIAAAILAEAPPEFALAGLSMGGYVALEMYRQAPRRILRIALLDTGARADTPEKSAGRRDLIALAERGKFLGVADSLLPLYIRPERLADEALVATIKAMARNVGRESFVRQERAIIGRADSRPLLGEIRCPALVLCGRQDALTPLELHVEMAERIPGAVLEVIEECGHLATLERPNEVNAALRRWLTA